MHPRTDHCTALQGVYDPAALQYPMHRNTTAARLGADGVEKGGLRVCQVRVAHPSRRPHTRVGADQVLCRVTARDRCRFDVLLVGLHAPRSGAARRGAAT